jgi:LysR family transcriptional regulator, low CO2-responsive transcriptional regulator
MSPGYLYIQYNYMRSSISKMHMNLHHLAIFNAIAETGSISAAAEKLHISQPAMSREIKDFESRLGVTLFERQPRGMRMTHAGEVLNEYAVRLFEISRSAQAAMREIADARMGNLSIGASNTNGTYILPQRLATFRRANPDVRITMFIGNTEQISQGVADMRYTLGFIEGPLHVDGLVAEPFQQDDLVPVVAANHELLDRKRLTTADLDGQPLLMREPGSGTRELITETLDAHRVRQGSVMEFGNTEALKQAAMHGGGIAWLPRISIAKELDEGTLKMLPIENLLIQRTLSIIRRVNSNLSPTSESFLKTLRASLKA